MIRLLAAVAFSDAKGVQVRNTDGSKPKLIAKDKDVQEIAVV